MLLDSEVYNMPSESQVKGLKIKKNCYAISLWNGSPTWSDIVCLLRETRTNRWEIASTPASSFLGSRMLTTNTIAWRYDCDPQTFLSFRVCKLTTVLFTRRVCWWGSSTRRRRSTPCKGWSGNWRFKSWTRPCTSRCASTRCRPSTCRWWTSTTTLSCCLRDTAELRDARQTFSIASSSRKKNETNKNFT